MSAVVGVFFSDGRLVDRRTLERMVECLAHRGSDGAGAWSEGNIGLGHRMLHTTPESLSERLPLQSARGNLVLTGDTRIDNRDELISRLSIDKHTSEKLGDNELILHAYETWGERCPERLVGDFAFAIWDRQRQTLFCARDHMGVKPLYYYWSGRTLVFASEIKALFCLPTVPRRLNESMVANYLSSTYHDKTITFYEEIFRLAPGHSMTVRRGKISVRPYWSFDLSRELRLNSDEEYAQAFREVFTEAVRCRLRSAFPVGSMLSGGLDSSSIVCVARKVLVEDGAKGLKTFSAVFDEVLESDERPFIDSVVAQGKVDPFMLRADRMSPLVDLERILWHEDEPFYASNLFMHWGLYGSAHGQGARVLLDGIDGDTVVSYGLEYLVELARRGKWMTLIAEVNALSSRFGSTRWGVLREHVIKPLAPELVLSGWRSLREHDRSHSSTKGIINPQLVRRMDLAQGARVAEQDLSGTARISRELHWRGLTSGIYPYVLEMADKIGAAFSVEPRYPFFDRRLMEFCLALPPEQKLKQGWVRSILRRALANELPDKVAYRMSKGELHHNTARNLIMFERKRLEEVILKDTHSIEDYVDIDALRKAYVRYVVQGSTGDMHVVFRVVVLALWLRRTGLVT